MFDRYFARRRGRYAARRYHEETGQYNFLGDALDAIAIQHGWCVKRGDIRWHAYVESACNEIDRIAMRDGMKTAYGSDQFTRW